MGVKDEQMAAKRNASRGPKRDDARAERARQRAQRASVDIQSIDPQSLLLAIDAAVAIDGALRIGCSRDGGAFAIGIYGDGEPYTEYVGSDEDINQYLVNLREYLDNLRS